MNPQHVNEVEGPDLTGRMLGRYELVAKLGAGGMGEVYRARDTRLKRDVALKVLPSKRMEDAERMRRFEQEARTASALNHPNIVTIFDIDQIDGVSFIAMEYVHGKTLNQLIPRRGLPLQEALKYAIEIAAALAAAHNAGIVHRDIKPSNVMLADSGHIKVLDFGLAKLTDPIPATEEAQTITLNPVTSEGLILGTVSYMSPEQAEGKPVDSRSDIFSFGSMLYEMLTGQKAFQGDTKMSTLAAIVTQEPAPLTPLLPAELERVVVRCLRKERERRYQHMGDVSLALQELKDESDSGTLGRLPTIERKHPWLWLTALSAAAAILFAGILFWKSRETELRDDLKAVPLSSSSGHLAAPSFSPDGNRVAFVWNGEKQDNYDIYVKQIGSTGPPFRLTTNPAPDRNPAWSPDDLWIALVRLQENGASKVILTPPLGGPERVLLEMKNASDLAWSPDGKWLVFSALEPAQGTQNLHAVSIATGELRQLTTLRTNPTPDLADWSPAFSPDGRTLAFIRQVRSYVYELYRLRLTPELNPDGEPVQVTDKRYGNMYGVAWTVDSRDVVYSGDGSLWRVPISGSSSPRRLSYVSATAVAPAIARTRSRLAYDWVLSSTNIWRLDTQTGERRILSSSNYTSQRPQYSSDGRKIAFQSTRSGTLEVWTCDADGSNCVQVTSLGGPAGGSPSWSPDGRWLAIDSRAEGQSEIYVISADGGTPRRITNNSADDMMPSWSQDGRWVYFASDRTGRFEIWKAPQDGGEAVQVTSDGGGEAHESPDGKYIWFNKSGHGPQPLFRMATAGGAPVETPAPTANCDHWHTGFSVTNKGVYFIPADGRTIQFLDTSSGKVATLGTLDRMGFDLAVSPDGRYIIWAQVDQEMSTLMLVDNFH